MPSHLTPSEPPPPDIPSELSTEMPPPLFEAPTNIISPSVSDAHIILLVGTIIVVGIIAILFLRKRKK